MGEKGGTRDLKVMTGVRKVVCYHRGPCGCPWAMLPLRAVMVSVAWAVAESHVDVCGLCCQQKPYGSLWSVLWLAVKDKEATLLWH